MEVSDFSLETGIPMPDGPQDNRYKYPWRQMQVGDSFFVPVTGDKKRKLYAMKSVIFYQHEKHPEHFEVRVVDGGVRVWRTE